MNFIETLQQLGGIQLCPKCEGRKQVPVQTSYGPEWEFVDGMALTTCLDCHGTGTVLNLATLLARPNDLYLAVEDLLKQWYSIIPPDKMNLFFHGVKLGGPPMHVVGPQRASNLVYEIASQLGGTAVVSPSDRRCTHCGNAHLYLPVTGSCEGRVTCPHRSASVFTPKTAIGPADSFGELSRPCGQFSLPVPPDATVLFVTDKYDAHEMWQIMEVIPNLYKALPYVLALVSGMIEDEFKANTSNEFKIKIITLHKE